MIGRLACNARRGNDERTGDGPGPVRYCYERQSVVPTVVQRENVAAAVPEHRNGRVRGNVRRAGEATDADAPVAGAGVEPAAGVDDVTAGPCVSESRVAGEPVAAVTRRVNREAVPARMTAVLG